MKAILILLTLFCFSCGSEIPIAKTKPDASVIIDATVCEDIGPAVICHKVKIARGLYIICENLDATVCGG